MPFQGARRLACKLSVFVCICAAPFTKILDSYDRLGSGTFASLNLRIVRGKGDY
jgi:hypothetical protein